MCDSINSNRDRLILGTLPVLLEFAILRETQVGECIAGGWNLSRSVEELGDFCFHLKKRGKGIEECVDADLSACKFASGRNAGHWLVEALSVQPSSAGER